MRRITDAETFEYATGRSLDIYLPKGNGPFPTVLLIHGGGWVSGSRTELAEHARRLNAKGLAAVSLDYRLAPGSLWPAQREDCDLAAKWVRRHGKEHKLKTGRLAAAGESAGGHLSMWLAEMGDVQAVGSISGLHDLTLPMTPVGENFGIVQKVLGPNYPKDIKAFSPLLSYKKGMPPVFFIHGKSDPLVPTEHATKAAARLKELGIESKVILLPQMGHGLHFQTKDEGKAWDEFADWVKTKL
ncbi:alpha/beta hydrolase [soil metagenome]